MSPEQKAAFINAQVALLNIELELMHSENIERDQQGLAQANGPEQWARMLRKYEQTLSPNALVAFFQQ